MPIKLNGSTSGYTQLSAPATAGNNTLTLPTGNGSGGQVLATDGSGNLSWADRMTAAGPAFYVYASVATSVANSTRTKIAFQTKVYDTNNNFDATTNYRFTPTVAGYYSIKSAVSCGNSTWSSGYHYIQLYKNGTELLYSAVAHANSANVAVGAVLTCDVYANGTTDYFEIYAEHGGAAVNPLGMLTGAFSYMQGHLIRPA